MIQPKPLSDSNAMQSNALKIEQTWLLYANLPTAIGVNLVLALILVYVQRSVIDHALLYGWLILMIMVSLYRAILVVLWHRNKESSVSFILRWRHRFRVWIIASGLIWGMSSILLFPVGNIPHQVFLSFVLAGLSAGAVTSLSVDRLSVLSFLPLTLVPLIVRFGMESSEISLSMGVMTTLFLIAISQNASRVGHTLHENIKLRIEASAREQMLRHSEESLNQAQQIALLGSFDWNPVSGEMRCSDEHFRLWGLEPYAVTPSYALFSQAIHPDDGVQLEEVLQQALRGERFYDFTYRVRWPDNSEHQIHGRGEVVFDDIGRAVNVTGTVQDVTTHKRVEAALQESKMHLQQLNQNLEQLVAERTGALRASEARFRFLFEHMAVGVAQIDTVTGRFMRVNQKYVDITGYTPAEILSLDFQSISHVGDLGADLVNMERLKAGEIREFEMEKRLFRKDSKAIWVKLTVSPMWVPGARPDYHIAVIQDITEHKQAEEQIHQLAFYDPLTRLPNRRLFLDRLQQAQVYSTRHKTNCAILFIDLDNFKTLNDTRGHDIGDLLLIEVAKRLRNSLRTGDTVARLGGDEFVVTIEGLSEDTLQAAAQAKDIGEKILASITRPFRLQEFEYHSSSSMGIRLFHNDEASIDDLLKHARPSPMSPSP